MPFPHRTGAFENSTCTNTCKGTTPTLCSGAIRVPFVRLSKFKLHCVLKEPARNLRYSGPLCVLILHHNIDYRRRSFSNQEPDLAADFSHTPCELRLSCPSTSIFSLPLDLYYLIQRKSPGVHNRIHLPYAFSAYWNILLHIPTYVRVRHGPLI